MIKNTSQFIEVWPISCLNDSETHERVLKGVNIQKNFPGEASPRTPLKSLHLRRSFRNRSVFYIYPRSTSFIIYQATQE